MLILQGKTVLIAGASSGMGRAIAEQAAAAGANLVLIARRADELSALAAQLAQRHPGITVDHLPLDTTDAEGLSSAVGTRSIDILVNSVGTNLTKRAFDTLTPQSWANMIDVNLTSAFNLIRAVLPGMRSRHKGLIINIASTAARRGAPTSLVPPIRPPRPASWRLIMRSWKRNAKTVSV